MAAFAKRPSRRILAVIFVTGALASMYALAAATSSTASDMAGIDDLHARDQAATLSGDPRALADTWTKDAVRMEPGGAAEVTRASITAEDTREWKLMPKGSGTLTYRPDIRNVQIHGDWAVEWGYFDSTYRVSAKSKPIVLHGKLLRVLHKDKDGKWRFSHVMWNDASPRHS